MIFRMQTLAVAVWWLSSVLRSLTSIEGHVAPRFCMAAERTEKPKLASVGKTSSLPLPRPWPKKTAIW